MTTELSALTPVHRFEIPLLREWAFYTGSLGLGVVVARALVSRLSIEVFFDIGVMALTTGLLEWWRPRGAVIITRETISAPSGWSGQTTLRLSEIDRKSTSHVSMWQKLNGYRVIRGLDGRRVTLNVLMLGRETVARILASVAA